MTTTEINKEIENTKLISEKLLVCVKNGQMEYYNDYLKTVTYLYELLRVKPSHNMTIS